MGRKRKPPNGACVVCKYDLATLTDDELCPECATPTIVSRYGVRLRHRSGAYALRLIIGCLVAGAGAFVALAGILVLMVVSLDDRHRAPPEAVSDSAGVTMLVGAFVWAIGLWVLASKDRVPISREARRAINTGAPAVVRLLVAGSIIGALGAMVIAWFEIEPARLSMWLEVGVMIVIACAFVLPFLLYHMQWAIVARLARRCGARWLGWMCLALVCMPLTGYLLLVALEAVFEVYDDEMRLLFMGLGAWLIFTPVVVMAWLAVRIGLESRADAPLLRDLLARSPGDAATPTTSAAATEDPLPPA